MTAFLKSYYRTIGWSLAIPAFLLGCYCLFTDSFDSTAEFLNLWVPALLNEDVFVSDEVSRHRYPFTWVKNNLLDEICGVALIMGLLFIGFARRPYEDEMIARCRLDALRWGTIAFYAFLLLAMLLVYGLAFFNVMIFSMFLPLIVFVARFEYLLCRQQRAVYA